MTVFLTGLAIRLEWIHLALEQRFLFDELHIYSPGKNQRYTFRFDKGNAALAQQVYQTLEPLSLATPTEPL